ncbi:MAG: choice-of-anchor Q domain-containing protein [Saprospiraceae bacterium]
MKHIKGIICKVFIFQILISSTLVAQTEKAMYVNDFKNFIGNIEKENDLLEYAKDSSYTYLIFYNINYIHNNLFDITDPVSAKPLSDFIKKAKNDYGISKIGAIGEKYAPLLTYLDYNLDHLCEPDAMFDVFNIEFEFWSPSSTGPSGYYCTTYLEPNGLPCTTDGAFDYIYPQLCQMDSLCDEYDWLESEIYIGSPTDLQCAKIAKCVDRVLVHYYRSSDVYNNGNSIYNYKKYRLKPLTDSVDMIRVMPIFNSKNSYMGPWLDTHSEEKAFDTWQFGQNSWDDETDAWTSKIQLDGYAWYRYTSMLDTSVTRFYVSTSGNNANSGSSASPWKDIDYACNNATPDSEILVSPGTYNEHVSIGVDSIKLKSNGETVIIDGNGYTSGAMIDINTKKHIVVDGFELMNNIFLDAQGILVSGVSSNITIENCVIHDIHFSNDPGETANATKNAQPIIVYGDALTPCTNIHIRNNTIYDCRVGYSEALAVNGNIDTFSISNNLIRNVPNIGIDIIGHEGTSSDPLLDQARNGICNDNIVHNCQSIYAANAGIYVDGGKDIIIENNTCYRNIWGIEIGCENIGKTTSNITIRNNVMYRNAKSGLALGGFDYPTGSGKVTEISVYNNTLYDNDTTNTYESELLMTYLENTTIKSNIIYGTSTENILLIQYSDTPPVNITLDSNLYYHTASISSVNFEWQGTEYNGFGSWSVASGKDVNTIYSNPLFVNTVLPTIDLSVMGGSDAIDNGININIENDRNGAPRPIGTYNDIGAYEHGIYWNGMTNYTWNTSSNWSTNTVPLLDDEVTIPSPVFYNFYPIVMSNTSIKKLYTHKKSKLKVAPTVTFEIQSP